MPQLTCVVDSIRDLYTCFGARAYKIVRVRTRWSGGRRGEGVEEVIEEVELLPTPLIDDLTTLINVASRVGGNEEGIIEVTEVSPRYSEDFLTGKLSDGQETPTDEQFYYEISLPQGGSFIRRRFVLNSAPSKEPLAFQWKLELTKVDEDRSRRGFPRG